MLVVKFTKMGAAGYLGHLDLLTAFTRTFRRGKIPVRFSEGFHPHMLLFFSAPLGVGILSRCEYCTVDTPLSAEEFLQKFNAVTTPDLLVVDAFSVAKNPNLAAMIRGAAYEITFEGEGDFEKIAAETLAKESLIIDYIAKGKPMRRDFRPELISLTARQNGVNAVLGHGQINFRADRLAGFLEREYGLRVCAIVRTQQFGEKEGKLTDVEDLIRE